MYPKVPWMILWKMMGLTVPVFRSSSMKNFVANEFLEMFLG